MKLTASLLFVLLASCVGPTLAPASEVIFYEIAVKAPAAPVVKACTTHLAQVDEMAADAVKQDPSLVYRKFSPADSAKLIAYINTQPPVEVIYVADLLVALVPGNKEAPVLIGLSKAGCIVAAVKVPHALYDATLKGVLGQDS